MSNVALRIQHLGKLYYKGARRQDNRLLGEEIVASVKRPVRRVMSLLQREEGNGTSRATEPFWALKDVSFDVAHGEALGIIGRNGAGKSTLLKILSRITKPSTGRAELYGRVGSLLEVGTGFHSELTGRENVFLNGAILGMQRAEVARKFDEIVAFAQVPDFIDTPVKYYSSGMYMRLAFAVAAHLDPEILVVDEVLAVGDDAFRRKCLGKMSDVTRKGRTVLFVSHDLTAIQALCSRAVRLSRGELQGLGPVAEQVGAYIAESKGYTPSDLDHPIALSPRTQLLRFGFTPNPVTSGQPLQFDLELSSTRAMRIDELSVILFDSLNRRIALIDLRRTGKPLKTDGQNNLKVHVDLPDLPIVEGEYRVTFWIKSDDVTRSEAELIHLNVVSAVSEGDFVPYHAVTRGVVELNYTVKLEE